MKRRRATPARAIGKLWDFASPLFHLYGADPRRQEATRVTSEAKRSEVSCRVRELKEAVRVLVGLLLLVRELLSNEQKNERANHGETT